MKEDLIKFLEYDCKKLQRKMEIALESSDIGTYKNLMRALSDASDLIRKNEWKLKFSEYETDGHKEVSVWEQNYDGEIRNHKKWNVLDSKSSSNAFEIHILNSLCEIRKTITVTDVWLEVNMFESNTLSFNYSDDCFSDCFSKLVMFNNEIYVVDSVRNCRYGNQYICKDLSYTLKRRILNLKGNTDYSNYASYNISEAMGLVCDEVKSWSVGHIDEEVLTCGKRSFRCENIKNLYDFIFTDISQAFDCIIFVDTLKREFTIKKTKNVITNTDIKIDKN